MDRTACTDVDRIRRTIREAGLDGVVATAPENVTHTAGHYNLDRRLLRKHLHACLWPADGEPVRRASNGGKLSEFHQALSIARSSCAEVRSQPYIALDASHVTRETYQTVLAQAEEVGRVVGGLLASVQARRGYARSTHHSSLHRQGNGPHQREGARCTTYQSPPPDRPPG